MPHAMLSYAECLLSCLDSMLKQVMLFYVSPLLIALLLLLVVLVFNVFQYESIPQNDHAQESPQIDSETLKAAERRLSQAIQIKTRSRDLSGLQGKQLAQTFVDYLKSSFPTLHKNLTLTIINEKSFVYHWSASASDKKLNPILLLAHYDVVPEQDKRWLHPAFSGLNDGEAIWGRGSLDNKSSMFAMLEAIENLLLQGNTVDRDVYLAFGHDEETGGEQGAKKIAEYFASLNLRFDMILDEGLVVTEDVIDLVSKPVALIGISEKGLVNLELSLEQLGGHASMPGSKTAVGQMSRALQKLEDNPMSSRLSYPVSAMLSRLSSETSGMNRLALSNLWLFNPLVIKKFKKTPATHAAVSTTIVATQISASNKINVLPTKVSANLNIRILPGDSSNSVQQYIQKTINNPNIQMRVMEGAYEPAAVSAVDNEIYRQIEKSISQVYPDVLVTPGLVLAATDSRHYQSLSKNIYRFMPLRLTKQDLTRIHGVNERILIRDYHSAIQFYWLLLVKLC